MSSSPPNVLSVERRITVMQSAEWSLAFQRAYLPQRGAKRAQFHPAGVLAI